MGSAHMACQEPRLELCHQASWGQGWGQLAVALPWPVSSPRRDLSLGHSEPNKAASTTQNNVGTGRCPNKDCPLPASLTDLLGTGKATVLPSPQLCPWHLRQLRLVKAEPFRGGEALGAVRWTGVRGPRRDGQAPAHLRSGPHLYLRAALDSSLGLL